LDIASADRAAKTPPPYVAALSSKIESDIVTVEEARPKTAPPSYVKLLRKVELDTIVVESAPP
jgi:hypothetical protein